MGLGLGCPLCRFFFLEASHLESIIVFIFLNLKPLPNPSTTANTHFCQDFMADAVSQAGDADSSRAPGLTSGLHGSVYVHRGALLLVPQWKCISSFVFYILSHLFHILCGAGSTVPRDGLDSSVIKAFPGVLLLWHFLYSVGSHPVSSLHIYTFVVSRAFMAGAACQAGDSDWSHLWFAWVRECLPWCSIVGATVTVHQFFCILHDLSVFGSDLRSPTLQILIHHT